MDSLDDGVASRAVRAGAVVAHVSGRAAAVAHAVRAGAPVALALAVAGCFTAQDAQRRDSVLYGSQPIEIVATDDERDGSEIGLYLATIDALLGADPVVRADTFRTVELAADESSTTTNVLNYALALATPGHPGSDAREAQRLLTELVSRRPGTLLRAERILAEQHLRQVEERLILDEEARQLRDQITVARAARNAGSAQAERQVETLQAENARLQAELDEAREKLDAITNIERSIRERDNAANLP